MPRKPITDFLQDQAAQGMSCVRAVRCAMLGARLVTGESRMLATSSAGKYFTRQLANPTSDWRVVGLKERVSETLTLTSNCR